MKKILLLIVLLSFAASVYADDSNSTFMSKYTRKLHEVSQKFEKSSDDIDAKIEEQQKKFEEEKSARDQKIFEQQKQRQESYDAAQKRLEEKREQLRKLLEE